MLPGGSVVKHLIVLSGERLANLFILRIQSHGGDVSERGSFLKIYLTMLYSTKNVKINQQISMRRFKYYNEIGRKWFNFFLLFLFITRCRSRGPFIHETVLLKYSKKAVEYQWILKYFCKNIYLNVWKVESPFAGKTRLYRQTETNCCRVSRVYC